MRIMVTGGAGYIGSATTQELLRVGHQVAVLDNLKKGHAQAVPREALFFKADLGNPESLNSAFAAFSPQAVVHFAAYSLVAESVEYPQRYFENNVIGGLNLLEAMRAANCHRILFSSTAAVYGNPESVPITEDAPTLPTNPYGESKLAFENIMLAYQHAYDFQTVRLRYFNAAGAHHGLGEDHDPETHLIPIVLQAVMGQRDKVVIYGEDYDTPDGTCIRDYISISDLANAHALAVEYMDENSGVFNLGNGEGYSVKEVVQTVEEVTGREVPIETGPRRPGDPPRLIASSDKARQVLGWKPQFPQLRDIISSAWEWKQSHPQGYADLSS
jgi:UDP-glucose 4-epimerase